jgi:hypothetical protein
VLGIENSRDACSRLDQDEVELVSVEHASGSKQASFVTESGLFSLILGSRKPEAKAFKKWVTGTVLPEIRKRGFFSIIEEQNARRAERLLAECFPNLPSKAGPIFRELIGALLRLRGEQHASGNPPWARSLASTVYGWSIDAEGQQAFRREKNPNPNGSHVDHSMFGDLTIETVRRVAQAGCDYARISVDWNDWKAKMSVLFGNDPLQLTIGDGIRRLGNGKSPKQVREDVSKEGGV